MTKRRMRRKASQKVQESKEDLEALQAQYEELDQELNQSLDEIRTKWNDIANDIDSKEVSPRRTDVKVDNVLLVWHPFWVNDRGEFVSAKK